MRLNDDERAMLEGRFGAARREALARQVAIGRFFDAEDFVEVRQAHIMADTESLGEAGVVYLETLAGAPEAERRVRIPTITDPRGADFKSWRRIRHAPEFVALERRADAALRALGVLMTDTCINYQMVLPPVRGEHLAFGDTGVVIYSNSVLGARTNYEGGPSALAAGLTGRTPRYGFHLDQHRLGRTRFVVEIDLRDWAEWGALGGLIGSAMRSYWEVPVVEGIARAPSSDDLKHFGAALASFGSTAMFHMVGITPEAPDVGTAFAGRPPEPQKIRRADLDAFFTRYAPPDDELDVVVFAAPQLSLMEIATLADLLKGKKINPKVAMLVATSPENKAGADRLGLTAAIEAAGAVVLEGVCFYQMHARELGDANGWTRLMTNSAKLVNIIGGYGYRPVLATMERCIAAAVAGKVPR